MSWLALEMEIEGAAAESMSDALLDLGADSVAIEEARAESAVREGEGGAPPWDRQRIRAIVSPQTDLEMLVSAAAQAAGLPKAPSFEVHPVEAEDWVRRSQSQFGSLHVGERLCIVPTWCEAPVTQGTLVLRLDPGLAFGTGSHPTTQLVLVWLERELSRTPAIGAATRVLDYGCGSGILALAAAKLGAAQVAATDNDPQALVTCTENAGKNSVPLDVLPPERLEARKFDLIVANILARPLIDLAPKLAGLAQKGARLALAGILEDQVAEVTAAYAPWFDLAPAAASERWALLAGGRR